MTVASIATEYWNCMIAGLQRLVDVNRGVNINVIGIRHLAPLPPSDEIFGLWFLMSIVDLVDKRKTFNCIPFFVVDVNESHLPLGEDNGHAHITPSSILVLDHLCVQGDI